MTSRSEKIRGENYSYYMYDPIYGAINVLKANERYVVIEVEKNPDVTPGGIVLSQNAVGESNKGVVISDGDADLFEDGQGFVGRTVFFPRYSGNKVRHEGKDYLVLKIEDILAYVSKD